MTRGRKPKPTHLKLVTANPVRRPKGMKEAKAKPGIPAIPSSLEGEAAEEWGRVSAELYEMGLLARVDRAALAAYCQSFARWHQAEAAIRRMAENDKLTGGLLIKTTNGNAIQNPLVGIANKAAADMVRYAAEFGMTPSARSRINAEPPQDDEDPTERFFA